MLDLINSTEKELLENMKKVIENGLITTQDKVDYYANELVKITKEINENTNISDINVSKESEKKLKKMK